MTLTRWHLLSWPVFWMVLAAATLGLHGFAARHTGNPDPFVYGQMAKQLLSGERLYDEIVLDKPPLAVMFYALPQVAAPGSYLGLKLFLGLCLLIQAAMVVWIIRPGWAGTAATALFVTLYPMTGWDWEWPSTEHFANFWVLGMLLLSFVMTRDGGVTMVRAFAVGALAALAFQTRPTTLPFVIAPLLCMLMIGGGGAEKIKRAAAAAGGAAAVMLTVLALVAMTGDVGRYLWVIFAYPRLYAQFSEAGGRGDLMELLVQTTLLEVTVLFLGLCWWTRHRWWLLAAFAASTLCILASPRVYQHYLVGGFMLPAVCMAIALSRWGLPRGMIRRAVPAVLLFLAVILGAGVYELVQLKRRDARFIVMQTVVDAIEGVSEPGETMTVLGPWTSEFLLFASDLRPAHAIQAAWHLDREEEVKAIYKPVETVIEEYVAKPPAVLVLYRPWIARLEDERDAMRGTPTGRLMAALRDRVGYDVAAERDAFLILRRRLTEGDTSGMLNHSGNP